MRAPQPPDLLPSKAPKRRSRWLPDPEIVVPCRYHQAEAPGEPRGATRKET